MGSKMSSNHQLVSAEAEREDWNVQQRSRSTSSANMEQDDESQSGRVDDGDSFDGDSKRKTSKTDHEIELDRDRGEDPVFDINENFDFDSDRLTVDSDIMTMDSICDGFDVVDLGDQRDVGLVKRYRPSRAAVLAGETPTGSTDNLSDNFRAGGVDTSLPNGSIPSNQSTPSRMTLPPHIAHPVVYRMDYPRRGRAVIVNETVFEPITGMSNRDGTEPDIKGLERAFGQLGFETETHCDLNVADFRSLVKELSCDDFRNDDCFVFIAMSHGEEGLLYCSDGTVCIDEVALRFKGNMCPTLVGKPKLLFFQACRGTQMDHGVRIAKDEGEDEPDAALAQKMFYTIPVEADFLIAYSSTPGYYSWRSLREGSWFIQALITIVDKYGTCMDLIQMMTRVNRTVAYRYESTSHDERYNGRKQMPCFVSTLTKELFFIPKK